MTRVLLAPACLLLSFLALPASALAAPSLVVTAREWSLSPSPRVVAAGTVGVRLRNAGQDSHDLALRRVGAGARPTGRTLRLAATAPGSSRARSLRLARGTWRLWCTVPNHRSLGMRSRLRVR